MNPNKFFSIEYTDAKGEEKTYVCRKSVTTWKDDEGQHTVKGTGHATPDTHIRLYAANRKSYRMFVKSRISKVMQAGKLYSVEDIAA
jgi:hypothetical protein